MKKLSFAAIVLTFILYALTAVYDRRLNSSDPVGYRNIKTCLRLAPCIGEGELRAVLGEPTRREAKSGGEWLEFRTLSAASAPIRADIDVATRKVVALWCRDDDRPTWDFQRPQAPAPSPWHKDRWTLLLRRVAGRFSTRGTAPPVTP